MVQHINSYDTLRHNDNCDYLPCNDIQSGNIIVNKTTMIIRSTSKLNACMTPIESRQILLIELPYHNEIPH